MEYSETTVIEVKSPSDSCSFSLPTARHGFLLDFCSRFIRGFLADLSAAFSRVVLGKEFTSSIPSHQSLAGGGEM